LKLLLLANLKYELIRRLSRYMLLLKNKVR